MRHALQEFALYAIAALVATVIVTAAYSGVVHGAPVVDWETSVRLALILGLVQAMAAWRRGNGGSIS